MKAFAATLFCFLMLAGASHAQEDAASLSQVKQVSDTTPELAAKSEQALEDQLADLFEQIRNNPEDLDINFKYAKVAVALGKYDEAVAAYERMLIVNSDLQRVKLDLALVNMRTGNLSEAERLFNEVLASEPPSAVEDNIHTMLGQIRKANRPHRFNGSISVGMNSDSNANSAAATNFIDFQGVSIPLDDTSTADNDEHLFFAFSGKHTYLLPWEGRPLWNTDVTYYKTRQSNVRSLDLTLKSIKTGPSFSIRSLNSQLAFGLSYSDVNLAEADYQRTRAIETSWQTALSPRFQAKITLKHEKRTFNNTSSNTSAKNQDGRANEEKLALTFPITRKDVLASTFTFRQENAETRAKTNRQSGLSLAYTRILENDWFTSVTLGLKKTQYKQADASVNPDVVRRDLERSFTWLIGRKLTPSLTATASYQQRDIESTIQNNEYKNERVALSLSWQLPF